MDGEVVWGYGCCGQTTRYMPGTDACLKCASKFFHQSRGSGARAGSKRIAAPPTGGSGVSPRTANGTSPSPRALMPPPAAKDGATGAKSTAAPAHGDVGGAAKLMGAGDHGATEITGRQPFSQRHASFEVRFSTSRHHHALIAASAERRCSLLFLTRLRIDVLRVSGRDCGRCS